MELIKRDLFTPPQSFPNNKFIYKTKRGINTKLTLGPPMEERNQGDSVPAEELLREKKSK